MRDVNFFSVLNNKAAANMTPTMYDRRALDCQFDRPLVNSLSSLCVLVSSSQVIRESLASDGGVDRLVAVLKSCKGMHSRDPLISWKWSLALQCLSSVGVRGSESVRRRVVEADIVPVLATVLDNFLEAIEKLRMYHDFFVRQSGAPPARHASGDRIATPLPMQLPVPLPAEPLRLELQPQPRQDINDVNDAATADNNDELAIVGTTTAQPTFDAGIDVNAADLFVSMVDAAVVNQRNPLAPQDEPVALGDGVAAQPLGPAQVPGGDPNAHLQSYFDRLHYQIYHHHRHRHHHRHYHAHTHTPTATANAVPDTTATTSATPVTTSTSSVPASASSSTTTLPIDPPVPNARPISQNTSAVAIAAASTARLAIDSATMASSTAASSTAATTFEQEFIASPMEIDETAAGHILASSNSITSEQPALEDASASGDDINAFVEASQYVSDVASPSSVTGGIGMLEMEYAEGAQRFEGAGSDTTEVENTATGTPRAQLLTHRSPLFESGSTTAPSSGDNQSTPQQTSPTQIESGLSNGLPSSMSLPAFFGVQDNLPREEDVLMSLQLLAYVSKYVYLRPYFQNTHIVPSLSMRQEMQTDEDATKPHDAGLDDTSLYPENDAYIADEYKLPTLNLFQLVERFTTRAYMGDLHYWASVIMRNSCRKDESRGGVRQCGYFECGRWEEYPKQFAKCRRCRRTKYCSKTCQSKAWSFHRHWCVPPE
ncbi:uncharacterized protein V1518DRAFT_410038 [Limtongia smithiae]|uniref:uncharacterized protein n=1 Tax=Limtongia smithiae TaxID=1125753 RepID=UPI0034CD3373